MKHLAAAATVLLILVGLVALAYHLGVEEGVDRTEAEAQAGQLAYADTLAAARAEVIRRGYVVAVQDSHIVTLQDSLASQERTFVASLRQQRASWEASMSRLSAALSARDSLRAIPGLVSALDDCTYLRASCERTVAASEDLIAAQDRRGVLADSQIVALESSVTTARAALTSATRENAALRLARDGQGVRETHRVSIGAGVLVRGGDTGGTERTPYASLLWHVDPWLLPPVTLQTAVPLSLDSFLLSAHVDL